VVALRGRARSLQSATPVALKITRPPVPGSNCQDQIAMKYKPLGRTGLFVSEICLGTMTFGGRGELWPIIGQVDQAAANNLLRQSIDAGINFVDTADVYSEGESERILGRAIKDVGVARKDVIVATKVRGRTGPGPNAVGLSRGHIMDAVKDSLTRLGTDYIDLYQIHGADLATPLEETLHALDDLVRAGHVRYVGCSNLMAWQIMKALGVSAAEGLARFETVQAYYSIAGRDIEREIVPLMAEEKLGLMVWSPLAGGLLSGKFRRDFAGPNDARRARFDFPPVEREHAYDIVDAVRPIAERHGVSVARVALAWLLHQASVMSVIIGAKTPEQLADNIAAADLVLSEDDLAILGKASALRPEYPRWMVDRQNSARLPQPFAKAG
jgi:aryl-alcohol dehydrogenase-like predicted oxidoreductase